MNQEEMMQKIERVLDDAHTAVLATVDDQKGPRMRWMTPVILPQWPHAILAVTAPDFPKIQQLSGQNLVEWMIQTKTLDQIVNVRGRISVVDNPSLKAQVMESIGRRLAMFWHVNADSTEFVVLETTIESACWTVPLKNIRKIVTFERPGGEQI